MSDFDGSRRSDLFNVEDLVVQPRDTAVECLVEMSGNRLAADQGIGARRQQEGFGA